MEEKDAIILLGKLEKFMKDTAGAIQALQFKTHNQQIDIDALKKGINQNRIIVRN